MPYTRLWSLYFRFVYHHAADQYAVFLRQWLGFISDSIFFLLGSQGHNSVHVFPGRHFPGLFYFHTFVEISRIESIQIGGNQQIHFLCLFT